MGRYQVPIYLYILFVVGCSGPVTDIHEPHVPEPKTFCGQEPIETMACADPWLPDLGRVHRGAQWIITSPDARRVRIGYSKSKGARAPESWLESAVIKLDGSGLVKVFAWVQGGPNCPESILARVYNVVEAYEPAAGAPGSTAIEMTDPRIIAWASEVATVDYGTEVESGYRVLEDALGPTTGGVTDGVSLGEGGTITVSFDEPISNGPGADFAVFENGFGDRFLELAFVEVSSDGQHFLRFPNAYLGVTPLGPFDEHDPELIDGLAGKYRGGYGTPFDLEVLAWSEATQTGILDLHRITHVRVVDIPGDGRHHDSSGEPIYDPFPVRHSAGFDLDGIAVLHTEVTHPCPDE